MISVIKVPDFNDSFSRVVLSGKEYLIDVYKRQCFDR